MRYQDDIRGARDGCEWMLLNPVVGDEAAVALARTLRQDSRALAAAVEDEARRQLRPRLQLRRELLDIVAGRAMPTVENGCLVTLGTRCSH